MRDFFFQIVLFLAGALIGIIGQFVGKGSQKWIARILAVLLIVISLIWAGYELGARQAIPLAATPLPTPTSTPSPTSSVCPSLGGMHLGAGKQFIVTMYNGCYYHFNVACDGCQAGEEDNFVVYYSGNTVDVIVPEGSVWQYGREPNQREVCMDTMDHWPEDLPSFLNLQGVHQLFPCEANTAYPTSTPTPLILPNGEVVSPESLARVIGGDAAYWTQRGPVVWDYWDKGHNVPFRHPGGNTILTYWAGFPEPRNSEGCRIAIPQADNMTRYVKCPSGTRAEFEADGVGFHLIDYTGFFP
jgi:hypothetical protein